MTMKYGHVGVPCRTILCIVLLLWKPLALQAQECVNNLNMIMLRESAVLDTSFPRAYVLCPNTDFEVGVLDWNRRIQGGQPPLHLRENLSVRCGTNGKRENGCRIRGGDVQVDGTATIGIPKRSLTNVRIEGVTFYNATQHNVWIDQPGNVHFEDCEFRENDHAITPILLDHFNADNRASELSVTFQNCQWDDNTYLLPWTQLPGGPYSRYTRPTLVAGKGTQNRLIFEGNRFTNNDMFGYEQGVRVDTQGSLVESTGPVTMIRNCFIDNSIPVSPVIVYGGEQIFMQNFQSFSSGRSCIFVSNFESLELFESGLARCLVFDITGVNAACPLDGSPAPTTMAPTGPTSSPTFTPTMTPSAMPTITAAPTGEPSVIPTGEPTTPLPTTSPTADPTAEPTLTPTELPTGGPISPTAFPTGGPTALPSELPTLSPIVVPVPPPDNLPPVPAPPVAEDSPARPPIGIRLTNPPTMAPTLARSPPTSSATLCTALGGMLGPLFSLTVGWMWME